MEDAGLRSNKALEEMETKIKELFQVYKTLQMHKETLVSEIDHLANDSLEKVRKLISNSTKLDLDSILEKMNRLDTTEITKVLKEEPVASSNTSVEIEKDKDKKVHKEKESSSFFDEIN